MNQGRPPSSDVWAPDTLCPMADGVNSWSETATGSLQVSNLR
jgi:hypothetical protein